tara:strand:+ start:64 stop:285 length:222 start_codon:yes stop_codon:yes gene_type:complete
MIDIDKIEQEVNWFMGDKDNQPHLAEYVSDLLAEVKRLREYQNKLYYALDLCASKEIERWIDEEEARIWGEEE